MPELWFMRNRKQDRLAVLLIVVGIAGLLMTFVVGAGPSAAVLCLIVGVVMFSTKGKPILQFFKKHAELKIGPIAPLFLMKYSDIVSVDLIDNKVHIELASSRKPMVISLSLFNPEDHADITAAFEKRAGNKISADSRSFIPEES